MKSNKFWSYAPYTPLMSEKRDIYICRIAPDEYAIRFDWLGQDGEYSVFAFGDVIQQYSGAGFFYDVIKNTINSTH